MVLGVIVQTVVSVESVGGQISRTIRHGFRRVFSVQPATGSLQRLL